MSQQTVILAPGQHVTENVDGRFFCVISATVKFKVELAGRSRREVRTGSKIASNEPFKRISFYETEGLSNTIIYDAGDEEYQGEIQVTGISAETFDYPYLMPAGGGTLAVTVAAPKSLPLVVAINGVNYTRKSFHIVNRTTGGPDVGIYDASGKLLDVCVGNTDRTFTFNQDVTIAGISGTCQCAIYYTLFNTTPE